MSSDNTDPRTADMPEWLPDNPCSEEAHQMVFEQSDGNLGQTQITAYTGGYFDGEGNIDLSVRTSPNGANNYDFLPRVRVGTARAQMAGLFDAEGCIKLTPEMSNGGMSHRLRPEAEMSQAQGKTLLEAIFDEYCNIFDIEYSVTGYTPKDENHSRTVTAAIYTCENIRKFLTPLLPLLYEKRRQAVIMLREILPRYEDGVHHSKEGFIEMMKWKRELDREKPMSQGDRKYTVEYFEQMWGDEISAQQRIGAYTD
jgi:hypothetical protein